MKLNNLIPIASRLKNRIAIKVRAVRNGKTWNVSQEYELNHAIEFMQQEHFLKLYSDLMAGRQRVSQGYVSDLILQEFFDNSKEQWQSFVDHIRNKTTLDIGPCVMSPIAGWDVSLQRHIIEPLYLPIHEWQIKNLGRSVFSELICHGQQAEQPVPELFGMVDGAIFCRNMLDHTPHWPFVLSLISSYAAKGCRLLLWTDLDHGGKANEGHYDITPDSDSFRRLIVSLGFRIERECHNEKRADKNWGCFAVKERV